MRLTLKLIGAASTRHFKVVRKYTAISTLQVSDVHAFGNTDSYQPGEIIIMFITYALIYFRSLGEECDDMNTMNGDGCSSHCKKEHFFNCIGKCGEKA